MGWVGDVDISVEGDTQIVRVQTFSDDGELATLVVGDDLLLAVRTCKEATILTKHEAVGVAGVLSEDGDFAVQTDLVNPTVRDVREEDLALCIHGWTFGEAMAFADQLPITVRAEDFHDGRLGVYALGHRRWPVLPKPAHGIGEDRGGVFAIVPAIAPDVIHFVARELKGGEHFLISQEPVPADAIRIVAAVLKEHPQRFRLGLANERWVGVPSTLVNKGADAAEDAAEGFWLLPCCGEGADRAAATAADGPVIGLLGKSDGAAITGLSRLHIREKLLDQESRIVVTQTIVFHASIEAIQRRGVIIRLHASVHDEHADGDRHLLLRDEVVENHRGLELDAVLIHMKARRLLGGVLRRHVDPVVARGAGEDLAVLKGELQHFTLGHALLRQGVRAGDIVVGCVGDREREGKDCGGAEESHDGSVGCPAILSKCNRKPDDPCCYKKQAGVSSGLPWGFCNDSTESNDYIMPPWS